MSENVQTWSCNFFSAFGVARQTALRKAKVK